MKKNLPDGLVPNENYRWKSLNLKIRTYIEEKEKDFKIVNRDLETCGIISKGFMSGLVINMSL